MKKIIITLLMFFCISLVVAEADIAHLPFSDGTSSINGTDVCVDIYGSKSCLSEAVAGAGINTIIAGTGLLGGGSGSTVTLNVSADTCGSGNVSKYNGTHFECVVDQSAAGGVSKQGDGTYTYNDSTTIFFNDTYAGENLAVNSSDNWDNLDTINSTQMENDDGELHILLSWFTSTWNSVFSTKTTDDLTEGSTNLYDNQTFNETHTDTLYIPQADEGDLNVNNSNTTNWWAGVSGWVSGWFIQTGDDLDFNETKLNDTGDARYVNIDGDTNITGNLNITGSVTASSLVSEDGSGIQRVPYTIEARVNQAEGITAGNAVYITGATGDKPQVNWADNQKHFPSHTLGIAGESGANGELILVYGYGETPSINTSAYAEGCLLHLSFNGTMDCSYPETGSHIHMGHAIKINENTGIIATQPQDYSHDIAGTAENNVTIVTGTGENGYILFNDYNRDNLGWIDEDGLFSWLGNITAENITANTFFGDGSQLNVNNSNTTNWWAGVSGWISGWFIQTGDDLDFDETKLNDTIDEKISALSIEYNASTNAVDPGTIDSGNVTSTYVCNDGLSLNISEVSGTPGFIVYFNFTNITAFNNLHFIINYLGGQGHSINLEFYNNATSSWSQVNGEITDTDGFVDVLVPVFSGDTYIDGNDIVQFRFNHGLAGNINHDLLIECIHLSQQTGISFGGEHDATSGRGNILVNHPNIVDVFYNKTEIDGFNYWNDTDATFNKTYADTLYAPISIDGTVKTVAAGDGMDFTNITTTGFCTMGTPSTLSGSTSNGLTTTSHTHEITSDDTGDCAAGEICGGGHAHSEYLENVVEDVTPQLGGYLDTNGNNIGATDDEINDTYVSTDSCTYYGDGQQASICFNDTTLIIKVN